MAARQSDSVDPVPQSIGFVKQVSQATAVAASGNHRPLHSGDPVYPFDKLINHHGVIVVEFTDGSWLDMGPGDQTVLDQDVFDIANTEEVASAATDVDALQQALLAGADPTQVLEPTAAGPAAGTSPDTVSGDGSSGLATIARDGSTTLATSGFTTGDASLTELADTASEQEADELITGLGGFAVSAATSSGVTENAAANPLVSNVAITVGEPDIPNQPEVPSEPAPSELPIGPAPTEFPDETTPPELPDEQFPEATETLDENPSVEPEDTTPPAISLNAIGLTNNNTPVISGTAEPGSAITIFVAGQTIATVAAADGSWSVAPQLLADGSHTVTVSATDDSGNQSTEVTEIVTIDSTGPVINAIDFDLAEQSAAGDIVGQVTATDINGPMSYQLDTATDLFEINSETGVITLTNAGAAANLLDFETNPNFAELTVIATDNLGNQTSQLININITNVNELPTGEDDTGFIKLGATTSLTGNVLINDSDPDGDSLTVAEVNGVQLGVGNNVINGLYGDLTIQQDGSYSYQQHIINLDEGLVAHWAFDELKGNHFDDIATADQINDKGRLRGNASLVDEAISGKALSLDGAGDYIDINNSKEINNYSHNKPIGGSGFSGRSISFGFKVDGTDLDSRQVIFEEGGNVRGLVIYIENGELIVGGYNRPDNINWQGSYAKVDITNLDTSEWHHVALVLDPDNQQLTGYLDGDRFQQVQGDLLYRHPGDISIGRTGDQNVFLDNDGIARVDNSPNYFKGLVDDGLVYNRVLTDTEVKALHSGELSEEFNYQLSDGELAAQANLNITLTDNLTGGATDDVLLGGDTIDLIAGGAGNDQLTGANGGDQFIWSELDQGTNQLPAVDIIKDFNTQQGDALNVADLLIDEDVNSLEQYLAFNFENGSTTINVSHAGNGEITQQIVLENVDLSSHYGTTDTTELIDNLLDDGHLIVD
ncbi:retention module-containing protein [Endozoicomonas sp. SM1973]|uniref:Retention module-containing protein n=1 Tax=Spartinivicinus marinus TaxID=2994442 RepID=A0A853HRR0_9GAMM|nr:retention module-containing protein [Spartinivicinus marinus]MCX4026656.1 retention module-containing protein [Spartinivicinus marinus]NYZ64490.1 retention module-containing protein [Spartinivicinus marinus]